MHCFMQLMGDYVVEGGIDFFAELNKDGDDSGGEVAMLPTGDVCLITNAPLHKDCIQLDCGHKFNYIPLYREIIHQKCARISQNMIVGGSTKGSAMVLNQRHALETARLKNNQIRCPYCRQNTDQLLPYYPYNNVRQTLHVNHPPHFTMPRKRCTHGVSHELCESMKQRQTKSSPIPVSNVVPSEPSQQEIDDYALYPCRNQPIYNEEHDLLLCKHHMKIALSKSTLQNKSKPRLTNKKIASVVTMTDEMEKRSLTGKCIATLGSGINKGKWCECDIASGSMHYCGRHKKRSIAESTAVVKEVDHGNNSL